MVIPNFDAVIHFLDKENWLKHGVIIFSRYFDTAKMDCGFTGGTLFRFDNRALCGRVPKQTLSRR